MKPDSSKLRQQQRETEQVSEIEQNSRQDPVREFGSVEEMLRFDAGQTVAPDTIAERLKESLAQTPPPPKSWWQRLFGGKS